jgi:hypothetical protein
MFPASAFVTIAEVSEAVVDAAVESDLRPPVAVIENISVAGPGPVPGGPVVSDSGRAHPGAGHPVVVAEVVVVGPVARCPDKAFAGAKRLFVYRKWRRSERDGEDHSGGRSRGHTQHHNRQDRQREQQRTNGGKIKHCVTSCLTILRFPGTDLLLRVARIARRIFKEPKHAVETIALVGWLRK